MWDFLWSVISWLPYILTIGVTYVVVVLMTSEDSAEGAGFGASVYEVPDDVPDDLEESEELMEEGDDSVFVGDVPFSDIRGAHKINGDLQNRPNNDMQYLESVIPLFCTSYKVKPGGCTDQQTVTRNNLQKLLGSFPHDELKWTLVAVCNEGMKFKIYNLIKQNSANSEHSTEGCSREEAQLAFLQHAPCVVIVMSKMKYGEISGTYTDPQSAVFSLGMLAATIRAEGMITSPFIPKSCDGRLGELLQRPGDEKPLLILPLAFSPDGATVNDHVEDNVNENLIVF